jgi:CubicO group peptidase (beta-lactamase class C family)
MSAALRAAAATSAAVVLAVACSDGERRPEEQASSEAPPGVAEGEPMPASTAAAWTWPSSTPEREGVDAAALAILDTELAAGEHGFIDALLVIRHGKLVVDRRYRHDYVAASAAYDQTAHPYNYYHPDWHPYVKGRAPHTVQSVTKSVTSALIGIAIGRGEIAGGVEAPALALLGDREFPDPDGRKAAIELADLLTMRAGIAWDESSVAYTDPRNDCAQMEASTDWIQFVLGKPMAAAPGEVWVYSSGVSQLLSGILAAATGVTADVYAERHLFGPLGIRDYYWKKTPDGLPDTEGGLYLLPEDLARIGYLYLHDGVWEGRRVVPEGWVTASVEPWVKDVAPANGAPDWGYGYQWWVRDDVPAPGSRLFAARGYGGQLLLVVPSLDLVTVWNGWDIFERPPASMSLFLERVVPAVRGDGVVAPGS